MDSTFWDRSWGAISPERIASYTTSLDPSEDAIIAFLQKKQAKSVCDAGCGCGVYALKLARFGFAVSGFDIAADAVRIAKHLFSENGYAAADFQQASVLDTGYPSHRFDAVVARDVIDHMPLRQGIAAVRELLRIVRPGGCVLLALDATDSEYEAEPHEVSEDGDYRFTRGKWAGMVFHPYSALEIQKILDGVQYTVLSSSESSFTVVLETGKSDVPSIPSEG